MRAFSYAPDMGRVRDKPNGTDMQNSVRRLAQREPSHESKCRLRLRYGWSGVDIHWLCGRRAVLAARKPSLEIEVHQRRHEGAELYPVLHPFF
ncbi:hypothetical protein CNECB9_1700009 [Cupriavidus necator]|uniref:Uncharacterized protein n=1 Tax=Cupriavidus necator TaxID=106590 RepID=A0A1K0IAV2_CUPNE|nr:hypothetical protein CNECB9_1700009 [Cupriavidus necator]